MISYSLSNVATLPFDKGGPHLVLLASTTVTQLPTTAKRLERVGVDSVAGVLITVEGTTSRQITVVPRSSTTLEHLLVLLKDPSYTSHELLRRAEEFDLSLLIPATTASRFQRHDRIYYTYSDSLDMSNDVQTLPLLPFELHGQECDRKCRNYNDDDKEFRSRHRSWTEMWPHDISEDITNTLWTEIVAGLERRGVGDDLLYRMRARTEFRYLCEQPSLQRLLYDAWNVVQTAHLHNVPVGVGRGSSVSSVLCWALGITDIDPKDLDFSRFYRHSTTPDIDIDVSASLKKVLLEHLDSPASPIVVRPSDGQTTPHPSAVVMDKTFSLSFKSKSEPTVPFTKSDLEALGVPLLDLLSSHVVDIRTELLTAIKQPLPPPNEKVWDLLHMGFTFTIPQLGSSLGALLLKERRPQSLADLQVVLALIRPGAKEIRKTYAINDIHDPLLFQEDIFRSLVTLGVSRHTAHVLLDGLIHKTSTLSKLNQALAEVDVTPEMVSDVEQLQTTWQSGYAFSEAHAKAYASIALEFATVKALFPDVYLSVVERELTYPKREKLWKELATFNDLVIELPTLNNAPVRTEITSTHLRIGLTSAGVVSEIAEAIVAGRDRWATYASLADCTRRLRSHGFTGVTIPASIALGC